MCISINGYHCVTNRLDTGMMADPDVEVYD